MCVGKLNVFVAVAPNANELYPPTTVLPLQLYSIFPNKLPDSTQSSRLVKLSSQKEDSTNMKFLGAVQRPFYITQSFKHSLKN